MIPKLPQGANKQGIKEHVKVKKKHDALGVGAVRKQSRARQLCRCCSCRVARHTHTSHTRTRRLSKHTGCATGRLAWLDMMLS